MLFRSVALLALDGALLFLLSWAYHSPRVVDLRISPKTSMAVPAAQRLLNIGINSVLSLTFVMGLLVAFDEALIAPAHAGPWRTIAEVVAALMLYDFAYYGLHRAMHTRAGMLWVHGVHHRVHNPTAMESFYLHPIELFAGISLLMLCIGVVGPVSPVSFLVVFGLHSTLNIVVHSGLVTGWRTLRWLDDLMVKHHVHHRGDLNYNLASLTPLPDLAFGTARSDTHPRIAVRRKP